MKNKEPFCVILGKEIIVSIFKNEIDELNNYAEDVGDSFSYIMGTDAWFELEEIEEKTALVCKSYKKTFLKCFIDHETIEKIREYDEYGILVISSSVEFNSKDLRNNTTKNDLIEWIKDRIHSYNLNTLIFAYYTETARKKHHEDFDI